jgi:hypothetical protein
VAFTLNENNELVPAAAGAAPALLSSHAFFTALVCTILPALADRPAAHAEWLALTRTALEVEGENGWPAALEYLSQLLGTRVALRKGFAAASESAIFFVEHAARAAHAGNLPTPAASVVTLTPSRPSFQKRDEACIHWNQNKCVRGLACLYQHHCAICSGNHIESQCNRSKSGGKKFGNGQPGARR